MSNSFLWHTTRLLLTLPGVKWMLVSVVSFTIVCNILMLVPSIYMLQVYDRVLTSFDTNTLYALSVIVVYLYLIFSILDHFRGQAMIKIADGIEKKYVETLHSAMVDPSMMRLMQGRYSMAELNTVKNFAAGGSLLALIDGPWAVVFILTVYVINPALGVLVVLSTLALLLLTIVSIRMTRVEMDAAKEVSAAERILISDAVASSYSIAAMGMKGNITKYLQSARREYNSMIKGSSKTVARLATMGKFLRLLSQSAVLAIGAYLVIKNEITAGAMIAASILAGRALQPVEGLIQVVKVARDSEQSAAYIRSVDDNLKDRRPPAITLPDPENTLALDKVSYSYSGVGRVLNEVTISVSSHEILGLVGPSGSGKSTLLKVMAGALTPISGKVLYDGYELQSWNISSRGRFIGYQSQWTDLLAGSIAHNISRLGELNDAAVIDAAKLSTCSEFIAQLEGAYDYKLGPNGIGLSEGQRKRICLARAYYLTPSFLFLDEPSNALDDASLIGLLDALETFRKKGSIVIVSTHNPKLLSITQRTAVLIDGTIKMVDSTDRVIKRYTR